MVKSAACIGLAVLAWSLVSGCGNVREEEPTPAHYVKGVRSAIEAVRHAVPQRNYLGMLTAADRLERLLEELPRMLERNSAAVARAEERKRHAQQAHEFFLSKLKPALTSLKYDEGEVAAQLDQLEGLIDQVDSPRQAAPRQP